MNYVPNIVTLLNLTLGALSIIYTIGNDYRTAAILILAAVIMDGMDGRVARKLNVSSEFGKELDSLCDLVSFGVAPSVLVWAMNPLLGIAYGRLITILVSLMFILCGAYRLARFNVINLKDSFVGVPITFAGGLIGLLCLVWPGASAWVFYIGLIVLSGLMVSKISIPKIK
ncbi:MAG: CDP-diacylglycerol--serine O-phosphatidyltransferase [Chitinophagales bacterium]